jgi:ribosome-associated protein
VRQVASTTRRPNSGVTNGTRTRDIRHHKPTLYQLSYDHQGTLTLAFLIASAHQFSWHAGGMNPAAGLPDGIRVNSRLTIPADEVSWRYTASGGPGGQHANTSNTKAEVVFDVLASTTLSETQKVRIIAKLGSEIRVACDSERSQLRNRSLAQARLAKRLAAALHVPKMRRPTKPSKGAVERRLQSKARNSERKQDRTGRWD